MPQFVKYFLLVLAAAISSAVLGGGFAAWVAVLSPEFVDDLFAAKTTHLIRYSAAIGAICGLFLGTAVMAFCLLISAIGGGSATHVDKDD